MKSTELFNRALSLLSRFYGYKSFRPGQYDIIEEVCGGRDAVVIMPTGGGKSLCYQMPALLMDGCAVVVSPLIALMQDQTQGLVANGIPAAAIHSNQSEADNQRIFDAAYAGHLKILYISPERLLLEIERFKCMKVSLFAIDEAHCISQWGHDFRPDYTELCKIKETFPAIPVVALTATADRLTRDDIATALRLRDPYFYLSSFDRPNISLRVYTGGNKAFRTKYIMDLAQRYPQDSGVVYCLSRKGAEDAARDLAGEGLSTVAYHAGMTPAERDRALTDFLSGRVRVVCATVAFGMGIDKSNIRWVVHLNMPGNIESYYQEIGRAGRDGLAAEAVLFYSLQDVIMRRKFAQESGQSLINNEKLARMQAYSEARVCRRRILLSYFGEERSTDCGNCDNCRRPRPRFDGKVLVQKAVSGVMRTGQNVGMRTLVNLLRGMHRSDLRIAGYDKLPTFGCGADLTEEEWLDYITQMVQLGVFEIAYENGNKLMTTPFGLRVMRGEEALELSEFEAPVKAEKKKKKAAPTISSDPTEQLFAQLKTVRTEISRKEGVPPYIVFSDATLLDMARRRPTDLESLLDVSGVGEVKSVKYGRRFVSAIRKFEGLNGNQAQGTSLKETLVLFNAGIQPSEIAELKGVKTTTILSHFAQLIDEGLVSDFHRLITLDDYKTITSKLAAEGNAAYEELQKTYTSEYIGLIAAIRRHNEEAKKEN